MQQAHDMLEWDNQPKLRTQNQPSLQEGGGDFGAGADGAAAVHARGVGPAAVSRRAVVELVGAGLEAGGAGLADEDAVVEVGRARRPLDRHGVTVHVDLARDVKGAVGAPGELGPRVLDLAKGRERGARVDGGDAARDVAARDGLRLAWGQRDGDERRGRARHPRAGGAPDDGDDGRAGAVDERVDVGPVAAEPALAVGGGGVEAERLEAEGHEAAGADAGSGNDVGVGRGRAGAGGGGGGGGGRGCGVRGDGARGGRDKEVGAGERFVDLPREVSGEESVCDGRTATS
jgi:hypothetical protein